MTIAVGRVVTGAELDKVPAGTVVEYHGNHAWVRVKQADGRWAYSDMPGHVSNLGEWENYKILFVPAGWVPEQTEAEKLALTLFQVKHPEITAKSIQNAFDPEGWIRVAQHVLDEFDRKVKNPRKLIDSDGDFWVLQDHGKYCLTGRDGTVTYDSYESDRKTRDEIEDVYGPVTVAA